MANPAEIERILLAGAEKARAISRPFMSRVRHAVGLRSLASGPSAGTTKVPKAGKSAKAGFKQYRERDGLFYFKLLDEQGSTLLQSLGFQTPQEAGRVIGALQQLPHESVKSFADRLEPIDNQGLLAATSALEALARASNEKARGEE